MARDDTQIGGTNPGMPTTHWSMLAAVRDGPMTPAHAAIVNELMRRYWKPVYCYIRRIGYNNEDAKDLTQEFFVHVLSHSLFGRADRCKGRFRALLLSSLDNFLKNAKRDAHAKKRRPVGGIVSLEGLAENGTDAYHPQDNETPQAIFDRVWTSELVMRVLKALEQCLESKSRDAALGLFRQRIIIPSLEGSPTPRVVDLAPAFGLSPKQADNLLLRTRRTFQDLLREELSTFAVDQADVSQEVRDLFQMLSR